MDLSQRELVALAFAGDDVQADFAADKADEAEAEAPKADAPSQLPGWGAWASSQRKPGWMAAAQAKAARSALLLPLSFLLCCAQGSPLPNRVCGLCGALPCNARMPQCIASLGYLATP